MFAGAPSTFTKLKTANLGFPRMGRRRELKFALEGFWSGKRTEPELLEVARTLRAEHWNLQRVAGLDFIPSNDFSLYDQVLDTLVLLGATPERFGIGPVTLERYFAMARNSNEQTAMEMTKWFDTNYHYLVPEWSASLGFSVDTTKLLNEIAEARALGIETRPVIIGPLTLLLLGKGVDGFDPFALSEKLIAAYKSVLTLLAENNVEWVQIDEPILSTDLPSGAATFFRRAYASLAQSPVKLMLTTYFDRLGDNLSHAVSANTAGLHIDLVRSPEQLPQVLAALKPHQILSLGLVEGRNIWLTDFDSAKAMIEEAVEKLGSERVVLSPSCSLLHLPHDLRSETKLPPRIKSWLRFAEEKLAEIVALAHSDEFAHKTSASAIADREAAESSTNRIVREQLANLQENNFARKAPYSERTVVQRAELGLPLFPTTTIGSFPQTTEVRKHRAALKQGHETTEMYEALRD